jgi:hypothetical protein
MPWAEGGNMRNALIGQRIAQSINPQCREDESAGNEEYERFADEGELFAGAHLIEAPIIECVPSGSRGAHDRSFSDDGRS